MPPAERTNELLPEAVPVPENPSSHLERKKRELRAQFTMRPLLPDECRRHEDVHWVETNPDVQVRYRGEFVVPYQRQIVAHGVDAALVLATAAQVTGRTVEELPLVGIVDPLEDMPR